jgi:rfaE bifunctional protein kinase chain/domain
METARLKEILSNFADCKVAVLGDFFLDLYIQLERPLSEFSLETHKEAFQAVNWHGQPGAAGVVTNNLVSLGAQTAAIGYSGLDGNGYTLRQALSERSVNLDFFIESPERFTPTYTKPMMREVDGTNVELNRIDLISRTLNPETLNTALAENIHRAIEAYDGILVVEQVSMDGCGTLSPLLRETLSEISISHPGKPVMIDSRHFASAYQNISLKMNLSEAFKAIETLQGEQANDNPNDLQNQAETIARTLWSRNKRPVFITLGGDGIFGFDGNDSFHHPGVNVERPIDTVGAGDSVLAGIGLASCAGATPFEAAYIGNLVGAITIQQLGTTGIATQAEILSNHYKYQKQLEQE